MNEKTHRIIWYSFFGVLFVLIIFGIFRTNYCKECTDVKEQIKELELTRYYLINGFCNAYNFTDGFKPLGSVVDNLTINCIDCKEGRCGNTQTFVLKKNGNT